MGHLSRAVSAPPGLLRVTSRTARASASPASSGIHPAWAGSVTGTATLTASEARSGTVQARPSRPRPPVWWSVRTTHQRPRSSRQPGATAYAPVGWAVPVSSSRRRVFVDPRAGWNSTPRHGRPDVTKAALTVSMSSESRTSTRLECRAWQPITPSQNSRPARAERTTPAAQASPGPDLATTAGKLADLKRRVAEVANAGSERAVEKQHARGKKTARERIEMLLDEGTFIELDKYARHRSNNFGQDKNRPYGDGVVTGYGMVDGRQVAVFAQDFTVFGGSLGEVFGEKIVKVMDFAMKIGCPVIGLNDSGGARIQEGVVSLGLYGEIFFRNVRASGRHPADLARHGPLRRRRRLLPRHHRLHRHGRPDLAHVHHRPRRHQDRHR